MGRSETQPPERGITFRVLALGLVCLYFPVGRLLLAPLAGRADEGAQTLFSVGLEWSLLLLVLYLLRLEGRGPGDIWLCKRRALKEALAGLLLTVLFWGIVLTAFKSETIRGLLPVAQGGGAGDWGPGFSLRCPPVAPTSAFLLLKAVTAGICEETVFRGYLLAQSLRLTPVRWLALPLAVLLSSGVFGFLHLQGGIPLFLVSTFGGLCCCVLVLWRRHLAGAITAHILFNLQAWYLA